jgi:5-methylcytosine-specific restriction protein A
MLKISAERQKRNRFAFAASRRPNAGERGYTYQWSLASKRYRAKHPLCRGCEAVGRVEIATVVDHVIPHKGDERLFCDEGNWQPSCDWHHNEIKATLEHQWERGEIDAAALNLDSDPAVALTRARCTWVGADGWVKVQRPWGSEPQG